MSISSVDLSVKLGKVSDSVLSYANNAMKSTGVVKLAYVINRFLAGAKSRLRLLLAI